MNSPVTQFATWEPPKFQVLGSGRNAVVKSTDPQESRSLGAALQYTREPAEIYLSFLCELCPAKVASQYISAQQASSICTCIVPRKTTISESYTTREKNITLRQQVKPEVGFAESEARLDPPYYRIVASPEDRRLITNLLRGVMLVSAEVQDTQIKEVMVNYLSEIYPSLRSVFKEVVQRGSAAYVRAVTLWREKAVAASPCGIISAFHGPDGHRVQYASVKVATLLARVGVQETRGARKFEIEILEECLGRQEAKLYPQIPARALNFEHSVQKQAETLEQMTTLSPELWFLEHAAKDLPGSVARWYKSSGKELDRAVKWFVQLDETEFQVPKSTTLELVNYYLAQATYSENRIDDVFTVLRIPTAVVDQALRAADPNLKTIAGFVVNICTQVMDRANKERSTLKFTIKLPSLYAITKYSDMFNSMPAFYTGYGVRGSMDTHVTSSTIQMTFERRNLMILAPVNAFAALSAHSPFCVATCDQLNVSIFRLSPSSTLKLTYEVETSHFERQVVYNPINMANDFLEILQNMRPETDIFWRHATLNLRILAASQNLESDILRRIRVIALNAHELAPYLDSITMPQLVFGTPDLDFN